MAADKIPDELWLEIFMHILPGHLSEAEYEPPSLASGDYLSSSLDSSPLPFPTDPCTKPIFRLSDLRKVRATLRSINLVSVRWHQIAVRALYHTVAIDHEDTATLLQRTLDETAGNSELGRHIRHLVVVEPFYPSHTIRFEPILRLTPCITVTSLSWRSDDRCFPETLTEILHLFGKYCGPSLRKLHIQAAGQRHTVSNRTALETLSSMTRLRTLTLEYDDLVHTLLLPRGPDGLSFSQPSEEMPFHPILMPKCDLSPMCFTHLHVPISTVPNHAEPRHLLETYGPHCTAFTVEFPTSDLQTLIVDEPKASALFKHFPRAEQLGYSTPIVSPLCLFSLPPHITRLVITTIRTRDVNPALRHTLFAPQLAFYSMYTIAAIKTLAKATSLKAVSVEDGIVSSVLKKHAADIAGSTPLSASYESVRAESLNGEPLPIFTADDQHL